MLVQFQSRVTVACDCVQRVKHGCPLVRQSIEKSIRGCPKSCLYSVQGSRRQGRAADNRTKHGTPMATQDGVVRSTTCPLPHSLEAQHMKEHCQHDQGQSPRPVGTPCNRLRNKKTGKTWDNRHENLC